MTKEELEKATGQELIDERNYCGVDGYYGDYLENVNAEMLKRFNRLAELEKENQRLKGDLELWESGACRAINLDKCGVVKELKAQIEEMKADVKQGQSYWNSCDMQYDLYQRLLDKWGIKENG